ADLVTEMGSLGSKLAQLGSPGIEPNRARLARQAGPIRRSGGYEMRSRVARVLSLAFLSRMSLGPKSRRKPLTPLAAGVEKWKGLPPRARLRVAVIAGGLLVAIATLATCGACGRRPPGGGDTTVAQAADVEAPPTEKT